jgi:hypothetical protein
MPDGQINAPIVENQNFLNVESPNLDKSTYYDNKGYGIIDINLKIILQFDLKFNV